MARPAIDTVAQHIMRARYAAERAGHDLRTALRTSKRTLQRWQAAQSRPSDAQLLALIRLMHPLDADLAAGLAQCAGGTLESLGVVPPQPPPPPVLPPMPRHLVVDAVVCAAADATDAAPSAVRAILLAAFKRARELGLATDEVEKALAERIGGGKGK